MAKAKPAVLLILDGWGYRAESEDNAIALAELPAWRRLLAECPNTLIHTEGRFVGLPDGQMGNSEVGHMNIGAGRIVYQDLTRVDAAIEDGSFGRNAELLAAIAAAESGGHGLHVMGLLSPGGVHSHEQHIFAFLRLAKAQGARRVRVHAFLDGRDMPPQSAESSLRALQALCAELGQTEIASVTGRYYAMDRDQRWERMAPAYAAIAGAAGVHRADDALQALQQAYARGETDEFVAATVLPQAAPMQDGDAVVFMNFRADRARQLTACFTDPAFSGFDRTPQPKLSCFVCLSEYDARLPARVAYPPESLRNTLAEVLSAHGKTQLRIAETEKYAHVTFFFNGGVEQPVPGEERILIPSPKVATYDLQPEMSCPELTVKLTEAIASGRFDAIICNIANPDMVGHTGSLPAAIKAAEAVDRALAAVRAAVEAAGGVLLVTADHGNVELMRDPVTGEPHTAHTVGPVYFVLCGHAGPLRSGGSLRDIAPTLLDLMALPQPDEMTGRSLIGNTA
ncbi:2,3-bisphosphoglycerate-independent phosphoglycerate mutase [Arenimonas sp. GDDSR-1]|uniref:2,3-bisphosphoglycerate-independent phosphoglycerate mutase n=1 Tax=Arenimonas sp. GDDSR-1 TaxID=2950125 RepID=UPI00262D3348|nr:2,3-bisphosphoglycerate-independent phosphoglycerate mutase [Arenimonas sp. GDDSR-1]